ncbi:MAG: alanine dehydrogenase [Flavobacteriales bacterium]|nr:alanine dehydrogenase [Flavobacteriales bacterium]|tara:strand:+ start:16583 stop:17803 length:1221 start_codon:yes stop_codon:yes gene_type:complete
MKSSDLIKHLTESGLMPQEEMLEVARGEQSLFIGIPKETALQENRVPLVPDSVGLLVNNGHRVIVESNAGAAANFTDKDYSEAGAEIVYEAKQAYKANIIIKVAPPTLDEISMLDVAQKQVLFSALQLTAQPKDCIQALMKKKVTGIAYDFIKDREGLYPIVRSMSEIAGNTSILIAAELLSNANGGHGVMMGGIPGVKPTEVVILGAGGVGEFAARSALGLGANVKIFDDESHRLRRTLNNLGQRVYSSILQPKILKKVLKNADVVIGALRPKNGRTPCVVTEEMVSEMKFGSVIIDVSIDTGGCFETSQVKSLEDPIYKQYGVTHYCVPNIASRVSRTASYALSNVFTPLLLDIGEGGGLQKMMHTQCGIKHGVYMYKGILTSKVLGETFNLPYKDLDLLMMAI